MCSKQRKPDRRRGFTLAELLIAMGAGSIILVACAALALSGAMNQARMLNYTEMDAQSQLTADSLTRDIRRANKVTSTTSNSLVLEDFDGVALTYTYAPTAQTFTRTKGAVASVLLEQCDGLTFTLGKRDLSGAFETFPSATAAECKVVDVVWKCSRTTLGVKMTTANMASAKIIIRRKKS